MSLSVIIPTKNKASRLKLTLCSLVPQTLVCDIEYIVVNDGATDETDSVLKHMKQYLPITVVKGPERGRAAARNAGAKRTTGKILLFIDDDIVTPIDFLNNHHHAHQGVSGLVHGKLLELLGAAKLQDPSLGGVGLAPLDVSQLMTEGFKPNNSRVYSNLLERTVDMMYGGQLDNVAPWLAGAGANISISKTLWSELRGFDEQFSTTWGCEDLEFAYRIHLAGYPIQYHDQIIGYHLTHEQESRWKNHDKNLKFFAQLHPCPEVTLLSLLMGPNGTPDQYVSAVLHHKRSA